MFVVKSKAVRDTKSVYGFVDTFRAKTRHEAESIAVSKYLENFADTGEFAQRFLQLFKHHKADKLRMIKELFDFFLRDFELVSEERKSYNVIWPGFVF